MVLGWLFKGLANTSEDATGVERTVRRVGQGGGTRASATMQGMRSFGNLEDFEVLRRHSLNALCGALMDRRTDCEKSHPFCVSGHTQNGDDFIELIAQAVPNKDAGGGDLIGIFLSYAKGHNDGSGQQDIMEYILSFTTQTPPARKLVVSPPTAEGWYPAYYGIVSNYGSDPSYPTGQLDPKKAVISVNCESRPEHCRWEYPDNELETSGRFVPTFHCLQLFGDWWVVEVDKTSGKAQKAAALEFADNPKHGRG